MGAGSISNWMKNLKFNLKMKTNDIEKFAQNIESKMFFDYDVKHLNWFNIGEKLKYSLNQNHLKI